MPTLVSDHFQPEIRHSATGDHKPTNATLLEGQNLVIGTIVGKIASGEDAGKIKAYATGNSDGSQVAVGILRQPVDATLQDTPCGYYRGGDFVLSLLTAPDTGWQADLQAVVDTSMDMVSIYG